MTVPALKGNVVEVAYNWPPEIFIERHLRALSAHGCRVLLVVRHKDEGYARAASVQEAAAPSWLYPMPNFDRMGRWQKLATLRYALHPAFWRTRGTYRERVLNAFFARLRPRLIHFHTLHLAVLMRGIPERLGIPYTLSMRGMDALVMPRRTGRDMEEARRAVEGAASVHAVSHAIASESRMPVDAKVSIIYTTVPIPGRLGTYPEGGELRLLCAGRLSWQKGLPDLLTALRALKDGGTAARLTIVGSGPEEPRLRYWTDRLGLKTSVDFAGKAAWEDVKRMLVSHHALFHGAISEGLANVVIEAMAWGCPVFVRRTTGAGELIEHARNGFLLPTLSVSEWPAIIRLALDRERMSEVRAMAYRTVQEHCTEERHAQLFRAFFAQAEHSPRRADAYPPTAHHALEQRADDGPGPRIAVSGPWRWESCIDLCLRALAPLLREMPGTRCAIYGEGPQEDELRCLIDLMGLSESVRLRKGPPPGGIGDDIRIEAPFECGGEWSITGAGRRHTRGYDDMASLAAIVRAMAAEAETHR